MCCLIAAATTASTGGQNGLRDSISHSQLNDPISGLYFGDEIPGLEEEYVLQFYKGYSLFIRQWVTKETVGTSFNATSCVTCHNVPMVGGSGVGSNTFVLIDCEDGEVFKRFSVNLEGVTFREVPPENFALRKAPSLLGLGFLENIPDWELKKYADPDDADSNNISGRLIRSGRSYGRFGWKGTINNIEEFVSVALNRELGVKTNVHGHRSHDHAGSNNMTVSASDEDIRLISQFIRFLGVPPRGKSGPAVKIGERIFHDIGCENCHRSSIRTGRSIVSSLSQRVIHPYTDLLVHDMGPAANDCEDNSGVSGNEFRTAPLWGLSSTGPPYLHDGRAMDVNEAIENHGGEASRARSNYMNLTPGQRSSLLQFLDSL